MDKQIIIKARQHSVTSSFMRLVYDLIFNNPKYPNPADYLGEKL